MLAAVSWDGGGGNLLWTSALNWSNDLVPTGSDDVTIDVAGTPIITLTSGAQSVRSLTTEETLAIEGGTLTVSANSTINAALTNNDGTLTFQNLTLGGTGTIINSGLLVLNSATVNTAVTNEGLLGASNNSAINGTFQNEVGAELSVRDESSGRSLTIATGFTNDGTIKLANLFNSPGAALAVTNGTLVNAVTGVIEAPAINGTGTKTLALELNNQGVVNIGFDAQLVKSSAQHINTGTINVTGGSFFAYQSGGSASFNSVGAVNISAGGTFVASGGSFSQSIKAVNGAGTLALNFLTASIATPLSVANLAIQGSTINLAADLSTSVTQLIVTNSTINGTGKIINSPGEEINLVNSVVNTALTNQGMLIASNISSINGTFQNEVGAHLTLRHAGPSSLTIANGFTNYGTIELANYYTNAQSTLTFAVTIGTLVNAATGTIIADSTNGFFFGLKNLEFELNNQGVVDIGYYSHLFKGSAQHINSGTINVTSGDFTVSQPGPSGSFTNLGVINVIGAPATFSQFGSTAEVINNGTINISPSRTLTFYDGTFTNNRIVNLQGTLTSSAVNNFNDSGILKGSPSGVLSVTNHLLGSTTNAQLFSPQVATRFEERAGSGSKQLEVMSQDRGATSAGMDKNFVYGRLEVSSGTTLVLVDQSDNSPDAGAEALYVEELIVASTATLNLNGLHLYARTGQISGNIINGSVIYVPDGGPLSLGNFVAGKISVASEVDEWTFYGRSGRSITASLNPGGSTSPAALTPALNFGRMQIIAPNNSVVASIDSTSSGSPILLEHVVLPTDGEYRVRISAAGSQPSSVGHYALTTVDSTVVTSPLVFNQRYTSSLPTVYNKNQWTFTAVAGQQVQFKLLAETNPTFRFTLTGPNGFSGFAAISGNSQLLNIPTSGQYVLTAEIPAGIPGEFAFRLDESSQTPLTLATPYTGEIIGSGQAQIFKLTTTEDTLLIVELNDADDVHRNELYLKFGAPPTRSDYDYRFTTPASADQRLLVPNPIVGDWYVLVYTESGAVPSSYTISAFERSLAIDSYTPNVHGDAAETIFNILGSGFNSATTVKLVSENDVEYLADFVDVTRPTQLTAKYAAGALPTGVYALKVEKPGVSAAVIENAFTVLAGGAPELKTQIILPEAVGRHQLATLYVEYENAGTIAMPAPILAVHGSDNALLTLDQSKLKTGLYTSAVPDGFSDTIQFLASGSTPGLLRPGEKVRVPVYYAGLLQPWDFSDENVEFSVAPTTVFNNEIVDWNAIKPDVRPSDIPVEAWDAVWANLVANTGATWGDYVRMLDDNARHLDELGLKITDISDLLGFEIRQAAGLPVLPQMGSTTDIGLPVPGELSLTFERTFLSNLSGRYQQSTLGRGWVHNWQSSLAVLADGTVIITDPTGSQRHYQPDSRIPGKYFSAAGDSAKLTRLGAVYKRTTIDGFVTRFLADGTIDYVQDPNGNRITAGYADGRLTSLTHTSGAALAFTYNTAGLVDTASDTAGRAVHYVYDAANQHLLSVLGVDNQSTQYSYDTSANPLTAHALTSIQDATGSGRFFDYDGQGRLTSIHRNGDTEHLDITYDSAGKVTIDNGAGETMLWFDHRTWIAKAADPLGIATYAQFCDCGHPTQLSDAQGHSRSFTLSNGLTTSVTDELGNKTEFIYGALATLTSSSDPKGNMTRYEYDVKGNLLNTIYADGSAERFAYDAAGNVASYTNRRGQTIGYAYNALGQVTQKTLPGGVQQNYAYDVRGNLTSTTDVSGITTYDYDAAGRLTKVAYPTDKFLQYTYDAAGRRTQIVDQLGNATKYEYTTSGKLESLRDETDALIAHYTYDAVGRMTRKDLGNGTYSTYAYDSASNVTHIGNHAANGAVNSQFDYSYDSIGRRVGVATPEGTWAYTYDGKGQLVRAVLTSFDPGSLPHQDQQYTYDAKGARTQTIVNGIVEAYSTNNLDQYTAIGAGSNAYDRDGNLVSSTKDGQTTLYTYSAENRLVGLTTPTDTWVYEYDALGNGIARVHNGERTSFLVDPTGMQAILAEYDDTDVLSARYTYGLGLTSQITINGSNYYDVDALGSVVGVTDGTGGQLNSYRYDAFGNAYVAAEDIVNNFQFMGAAGAKTESHKLILVDGRYYEPASGQFVSVDPLHTPSSNPYLYTAAWSGSLASVSAFAIDTCVPAKIDPYKDPGKIDDEGNFNPNLPGWCDKKDDKEEDKKAPMPGGGAGAIGGSSGTAGSSDPNDKIGPSGFGAANYVADNRGLAYQIDFENDAKATAPAQQVLIKDQLSSNFDWSTLELGTIGFGDVLIEAPAHSQHFQTTTSTTYNGKTFNVEIEIGLISDTGLIYAVFQSIDPETELPPDVLTGFLPPEDGTGRGMGFFTYTIQAKPGLPSGTAIRNIAIIQFDGGEIIATNQIEPHDPGAGTDPAKEALVTIDAAGPTSQVTALAAASQATFAVSWTGADDAGGSGVASYDVFVSVDGGAFALWLDDATELTADFAGETGRTYAFYSVATDNVGHVEAAPAAADATTTVSLDPADFNGDGAVDGDDLAVWGEHFGQSPADHDEGDADMDADIDGNDFLLWQRNLSNGGETTDFNGDDAVDGDDLAVWGAHFGQSPADHADGDADMDADVDGNDFLLWQRNLDNGGGTTVAATVAFAAADNNVEVAAYEPVVVAPLSASEEVSDKARVSQAYALPFSVPVTLAGASPDDSPDLRRSVFARLAQARDRIAVDGFSARRRESEPLRSADDPSTSRRTILHSQLDRDDCANADIDDLFAEIGALDDAVSRRSWSLEPGHGANAAGGIPRNASKHERLDRR